MGGRNGKGIELISLLEEISESQFSEEKNDEFEQTSLSKNDEDEEVIGKELNDEVKRISSNEAPWVICFTITETGIRIPRMHARPPP